MSEPLIFEISRPGREGVRLPASGVPLQSPEEVIPGEALRQKAPALPELSELQVARHFDHLARENFGVDTGFYPLGSCTMKYNPKILEELARLPGFAGLHPDQPVEDAQGMLALMYDLEQLLCRITGMEAFTLQPAAGAHGELTGMMVVRAYHRQQGEGNRDQVLIPDTAHGTNPASVARCGMEVVPVPSGKDGLLDLDALAAAAGPDTAALMVTNPNTLGKFETGIKEAAEIVHRAGGLMYMDGANMNALLGAALAAGMGFDVIHLNLHKTFAAPHGGGGPGSGPLGVTARLAPYLPIPRVVREGETFTLKDEFPLSIGRVRSGYGNLPVIVKAYAYIRALGGAGLKQVARGAVLNANYLQSLLAQTYPVPYPGPCMHEFVITPTRQQAEAGVKTMDIAKALMDYGFHPPTVYFPLTVSEAMMIEPTETESRETLESFAAAMAEIARLATTEPDQLKAAPNKAFRQRLDQVSAARRPDLRWEA